jgi:hypothetical protein
LLKRDRDANDDAVVGVAAGNGARDPRGAARLFGASPNSNL